ncbi:amino acid transporter [Brevibacillus fluminis]|uniref:Amino acid transporter n=1 Tax=Brevibacillus fluminis TaxID=511487 RepID=A0A3M8CU22_9BACL|nr:LysE/ArgO family amino acid transporter [Brevibacillus fluminis]RNB79193.1 amino acid transporter [Brevibacillus fluminis]
MWTIIFHGIVLSFGLILPLGVQNVFIFQQGAYQRSYWRALPVILTASLCDTLLITLAITGVSVLVLASTWVKTILLLAGFVFLVYMGWITWNSKPRMIQEEKEVYSWKKQIAFAASVSLLNPHAILDTIGVIGTSSLQYAGQERWAFAISCIAVSWIWFFSLALAGRLVGRIDSSGKLMVVLNKCSAVIIWAVSLMMLWTLFAS